MATTGPAGNERLTTSVGLVLIVLLGLEALTTLSLESYLSPHIFLGLLLLPPIGLKLASTGWRFMRYYGQPVVQAQRAAEASAAVAYSAAQEGGP